ncbi:hypothetical protein GJ496_003058 [Pomphorhynchus laevis]|nr:hypothetical protein GJ496_003058 [Pomphorhynchus laevis]
MKPAIGHQKKYEFLRQPAPTHNDVTLPSSPLSLSHSLATSYNMEAPKTFLPDDSKVLSIIKELTFNDARKMEFFLMTDSSMNDISGCSISRILDICSISLDKGFIEKIKKMITKTRCSNMYLCGIIDSELNKEKTGMEKCLESQRTEIASMTDVITSVTKSLSLSSERLPLLFSTVPKIVESLNNQSKFNDILSASLNKVENDKKYELASDRYTTYSHSIDIKNSSDLMLNVIGFERLDEDDNTSFLAQVLTIKGTKMIEILPDHIFENQQSLIGERAYDVIKSWESLIMDRILSTENSEILDSSAYEKSNQISIIKDIDNNNLLSRSEKMKCIEIIDDIYDLLLTIKDPCILSQTHGMYRIWGHPGIDAKEGSKKVKELGTNNKIICPHTIMLTTCLFKETIVINYHKERHRYPNLCFIGSDCSYIKKCISDYLNLLMSDKSLSPNLKELERNKKDNRGMGLSEDRRVIVKWLKTNFSDVTTFLQMINDYGIDKNELVIGLSPKEREVKPIPRMFAVTSMPIRSYVVITEEMIATDFLPLFPEITMKDDLQKLTERMISATASEKRTLGSINTKVSYKIFYEYRFSEMKLQYER